VNNIIFGVLNLSFWGHVLALFILTQVTIAAVSIYLHRHQTHKALSLHPIISHFFRFWLWLTTGMVTKEWVSIHRKHHASSDVDGDPHSPLVFGIKKVFWEGAELYREASKDEDMIAKYSHGTPNDWIERYVYTPRASYGIALMFFIDLLLFGVAGITIWALQMIWIPLFAAGVINGIGHYWGYRNYECRDAARNINPLGLFLAGEELHNNHHAFASSAKFSSKWWEFDMGWTWIRILSFFGLARVHKLAPKLAINQEKTAVDLDTVKAVIANRLHVMSSYYKLVIRPILKHEKIEAKATEHKKLFQGAKRLLRRENTLLTHQAKTRLDDLLSAREKLKLVYSYKQSLQSVWLKTASTQKDLIEALQHWCHQAEQSGLAALTQFAQQIKGYVPV
jgi:stearoyl-CoA desaturase (delta-9 desaturase)